MGEDGYRPMMSDEYAATLRLWHEAASIDLHRLGGHEVSYLGLDLFVPEHVFPPTPTSDLLGRAVLDEVGDGDRVLDMGTGSGVNAILAASRSRDVVGVDVNPLAVAAAVTNAERNRVAARTTFLESDLFAQVDGTFDVIVFDPPFRWFRPRDLLEVAFADENYRTLTTFMSQVRDRLRSGGRVLLFFGTSGDMEYLRYLIDRSRLSAATVASRDLTKDGVSVTYTTFRLTAQPAAASGSGGQDPPRPGPQGAVDDGQLSGPPVACDKVA
jgi:release factor glutamine methyltransferase